MTLGFLDFWVSTCCSLFISDSKQIRDSWFTFGSIEINFDYPLRYRFEIWNACSCYLKFTM